MELLLGKVDELKFKLNYSFLLQAGAVVLALASAAAILVAALAISSLISLATGGVGTAVAISTTSALASFGLLKLSKNSPNENGLSFELKIKAAPTP